MDYSSQEAFSALLEQAKDLTQVAHNVIFSGVPYVFRDEPHTWTSLRLHLARDLGCTEQEVHVAGSAKTGFSLAPHKYGQPFSARSDIDVIIINEHLFDTIWLSVIRWHYRRRNRLPKPERRWDDERRKDLYWGYINPVGYAYRGLSFPRDLHPARKVSRIWFNAFQGLGRYPEFVGRKVSGRLYRSNEHAVCYHRHGLELLRHQLRNHSKEATSEF